MTRRDIFDSLSFWGLYWPGRLQELDFLSRIFTLEDMPSTDKKFSNAYDDIWQHRINNDDWDSYWIFTDTRLNLLFCKDEIFLHFLCEMLHPVVRKDPEVVEELKDEFNRHLQKDGFQLIERTRHSGRPIYAAHFVGVIEQPALRSAKNHLPIVDDSYISQQFTRMESGVVDDPGLAIGTAKELVETVCKTILEEREISPLRNVKLMKPVRQTADALSLTPEHISESAKGSETIKSILGSLSTITQGMAEIRNAYGTGHGKSAGTKGLGSRHARLVVGAASTLVVFLWETHKDR